MIGLKYPKHTEATPMYNPQNVFARILRAEIPCSKVFEDDHVLAFKDIQPRAKVHVLVIPKEAYVDSVDFYTKASAQEMMAYHQAIVHIVKELNLEEEGFRLLSNQGLNGGQEVPHFHTHIFGGQPLGPMLCPHGR
jgi:diadenosine tetraphosphate (Ap4A) HIT family hydrolase